MWLVGVGMAGEARLEDPRRAEAKRWVERTSGVLVSNLVQALSAGGAAGALESCSVRVPDLMKAAATNSGMGLVRVSHRPRNPANRAGKEDLEAIREWEEAIRGGRPVEPRWTVRPDGTATLHVPIRIALPTCLKCHGSPGTDIEPRTLERIRAAYPSDEATGFRVGGLRGAWRVDLDPVDRARGGSPPAGN